jgi:hypothetical protein
MHPRSNQKPPGTALRAIVLALALATILVACTSSGNAINPLKTTPTTPSQGTAVADPSTTSTLVTSDGAIFSAYQAQIALFYQVASQNPVNPADPRLPMVEMGQALSYDRTQLTGLGIKRQHDVGAFVVTQFKVTQRNVTGLPAGDAEAVAVTSCAFDTIAVVDDSSGAVITPATNSRYSVEERLDLVNGRWMVSQTGQGSGTC